jgi:chaperone required for assembly of F1-ATPase
VSGWAAKRFWTNVTCEGCEGGYTLRLDARAVKTPAKVAFVVPTLAMAEACAAEWEAQSGKIRPETMPMTRYANSAIDNVARQHSAVVEVVAAYGETDLLCYRATHPEALIARQAAGWDPLLDWAAGALSSPLRKTHGIIPIDQDPQSVARLHALTAAMPPFHLATFHDLVAITGSLILGLAIAKGRLSDGEAFALSRIDEHWQAELWGWDEEAAKFEAAKKVDLAAACRFLRYCG